MKKSIFINAVGLLLFFSSCGNQESPTTQQAPSEEQSKATKQEEELKEKEKAVAKQIKELEGQLQNDSLISEEKAKLEIALKIAEAKEILLKVIAATKDLENEIKTRNFNKAKKAVKEAQNYAIKAKQKLKGIYPDTMRLGEEVENAAEGNLNTLDWLKRVGNWAVEVVDEKRTKGGVDAELARRWAEDSKNSAQEALDLLEKDN